VDNTQNLSPSDDLDDTFPPIDDFNGSDNRDFNDNISLEERHGDVSNDYGVNNYEYFPPSWKLKGTDEDGEYFPPSEAFKGTVEDNEYFPTSGNFKSNDDDYDDDGDFLPSGEFKGTNDDDGDFPPCEDFKGIDDAEFPPNGEFDGVDSVQDDDAFSSSEDLHGRSNDIDDDVNNFPIEFYIPLNDEIINEDDDGPRSEDRVLSHPNATIWGSQHSLDGSPNNVECDYNKDDITPSEEDILDREDYDITIKLMETIQRSIAFAPMISIMTRPFYINPNHSSYTRCRK